MLLRRFMKRRDTEAYNGYFWVIWQSKQVAWKWLMLDWQKRPLFKMWVFKIWPTNSNKFMLWPRFHAVIHAGPIGFDRCNSSHSLWIGNYRLIHHY
jgi:hypothetical protein